MPEASRLGLFHLSPEGLVDFLVWSPGFFFGFGGFSSGTDYFFKCPNRFLRTFSFSALPA